MQCDHTTNLRHDAYTGALRTAGGGRCSRRASYTDGNRNFCAQHAKVAATVMTKAKNQIRPECVPIGVREEDYRAAQQARAEWREFYSTGKFPAREG